MCSKSTSQPKEEGTFRPWTMDECRQSADEGGYFERVLSVPSEWLAHASLDEFWRSVAASICEAGIPLYDMTFTILDGVTNYNRVRVRASIDPKASADGGYSVNSKKKKPGLSKKGDQTASAKAKGRKKKGGEKIDGQVIHWQNHIRLSEEE